MTSLEFDLLFEKLEKDFGIDKNCAVSKIIYELYKNYTLEDAYELIEKAKKNYPEIERKSWFS